MLIHTVIHCALVVAVAGVVPADVDLEAGI